MKKYLPFAFIGVLIIISGFYSLQETFKLTIFGDDWLSIWRYNYHLGIDTPPSGKYNFLSYFLTVYGPEDISVGILHQIFGNNSFDYYLVSFTFRMIAALSVIPLMIKLTKSKFAGFIASLFFAITVIGGDATNWVFNMPSYLGLTFLNIFLYVFVSREKTSLKHGILIGILFYITFVIQPIRMTGLPFIIVAFEIFWILQKYSKKRITQSLFLLILILLAFLAVKYSGSSLGSTSEHFSWMVQGLNQIVQSLKYGHPSILMNPFILLGSLFLPDLIWDNTIHFSGNLFYKLVLPFLLIFLGIIFLFYKSAKLENKKKTFLLLATILSIFWTLLINIMYKVDYTMFLDPYKIGEALIGGYFVILAVSLLVVFWRTNYARSIFLPFCIIIFSFVVPWLFAPGGYFATTHRYLIVAAMGIGMFWASLTAIFVRSKLFYLFVCIMGTFFIFQIQANHLFYSHLVASRGNKISDSIWSQIQKDLPNIKTGKHPLVFYFEGDSTNSDTIYQVITFGFPPHIALLYKIYHDDDRIPIPIDDYQQLQEIIATGKPLRAYGRRQTPLPVDHVYAFKLLKKNRLVNITQEIRKKLETNNNQISVQE